MKKILLFFITLLFVPGIVNAYTRLEASSQSPVVDSPVYIGVNLDYGTDAKINEIHFRVTYDPSALKLEETPLWLQIAKGESSFESGVITLDKYASTGGLETGTAVQMKFRILKEGQTTVQIKRIEESPAYFDDGSIIPYENSTSVTIYGKAPSSSTQLRSLTVKGYRLTPTFSTSLREYKLDVEPEVESIYIITQRGDAKQTIEGDGERKVDYGINKLRVMVRAQNGDTSEYVITVNRKDNRTGDTSLKEIIVSNSDLKYEKDKTEYTTTVSRSIDNVLITARTTDEHATLVGTGRKNLQIGENNFVLKVTSSGGNETDYKIKIIRSTEEFQIVATSNKLLSLKVNGLNLDLSNDKTSFLYGIPNDATTLNIIPVAEIKTAKTEIFGNEDLKVGLNAVVVKAIENDESETAYTIVVYKNPEAEVISDINSASLKKDSLYETTTPYMIDKDAFGRISNNNVALYYNYVNMYGGLLYQVKFQNNLTDDLEPKLAKSTQNPLTYESNIPAGNEITLHLEDVYKDGNNIKIYSYNDNGQYKLITAGITVNKGYVTFESDGSKYYVFTTQNLIMETNPITAFIEKNLYYVIGGVVLLLFIIAISTAKKKKKKEENINESSY